MPKTKWASSLMIALLVSTLIIGGMLPAATAVGQTDASGSVGSENPAVKDGMAEFSNHTFLTCLPDGAQVSGMPVAPVIRNDIVLAGTPMSLQVSGIDANALAAGVIIKMPANNDQAVLAYYDETRKPVPGWIMQPGSSVVVENGQRYVMARVHRFSVYAPVVLNARLAADSITEDAIPVQYTDQFIFPYIPKGYVIRIMNTSKPELVGLDGVVTIPPFDMDTRATVNFRIFKENDVADTENMDVKVLAPKSAAGCLAAAQGMQTVGKIFGMIEYAGNDSDLQVAFKALEKTQLTDLQKLLGKDMTVTRLYSMFLAHEMEMERICAMNRADLLQVSGRSDAELMAYLDIYSLQAWQNVCQMDDYRWFSNRLQELGWSLEMLDHSAARLSVILDHGDAVRLNQMRSYLRAHTQLMDGLRRLPMGGTTSYSLAFFGYDPESNPLESLTMVSSAPQALSLSGPDGKPETGTMNPLWVLKRGTAVITVKTLNNNDPLAYLTKFQVGGGFSLGIYSQSLPNALSRVRYSANLLEYGGYGSTTWEVTEGSLPSGLTIEKGIISGVPNDNGVFDFTLQVTDGVSEVTRPYTLVIMKNTSAKDVLAYLRSQQAYYLDADEKQAFIDGLVDVEAFSNYQWNQVLPNLLTQQVRQIYQ